MREREIQRLKKRLEREGGGKREEGGAGGVKLKAGALIEWFPLGWCFWALCVSVQRSEEQ